MVSPEAITLLEAEPIRMLQIEVSCTPTVGPEACLWWPSPPCIYPLLSAPSPAFLFPFHHSLPLFLERPVGLLLPVFQTQSPRSTCLFQKWNCVLFPLSLLSLFGQGERDLPEVSRRDLELLIAEEEEAILLEEREGRPIWLRRARAALDGQSPDMGSLGLGSAPISSLLCSET